MILTCALFSDHTTIVGISWEIDDGVRAVKSVKNEREEQNNDPKEKPLEFGTN